MMSGGGLLVGYRYSDTLQLLMTASSSSQSLQVHALPSLYILARTLIHSVLIRVWRQESSRTIAVIKEKPLQELPSCHYECTTIFYLE